MLTEHKNRLAALFQAAARQLIAQAGIELAPPVVELDRPKQASHGDLASNLALQLARALKSNPRQVAEQLKAAVEALDRAAAAAGPASGAGANEAGVVPGVAEPAAVYQVGPAEGLRLIESLEIAGPGFINLRLTAQAKRAVIGQVLREGERFGRGQRGAGRQVMIEFVSANPTGPLHVGHGRQGALGDALAALLDADDLDAIRRFAVAYLRHEQDIDLRAFGVRFDNYYLESSLYEEGRVQSVVDALVAAGRTYEEGGALWLRTTDYGADKDRVMRKSEGGYTYFVPDVAYHVTKWQRGFARAINVQGSDHHGTIARVRAGLQALGVGIPAGYPDYVLHKMVTVMKGGQEVKISKRAGSYVTLRDLITWTGEVKEDSGEVRVDERRGRDAVRFFLISRKADSEFVFDVDLALARTDENPVYYIQYAHARICSVLAQWGGDAEALAARAAVAGDELLAPLAGTREFALTARLAAFPEMLTAAVDDLAPHAVAFYLKDLASDLHSYYNAERVLVDDEPTKIARLVLLIATRQVLRNGLALIGVSAPERM